jgi:hypothetical protein
VVQTQGGLGNQLFQASFAHFLALEFPNRSVIFRNANHVNDRNFELSSFFDECPHISAEFARLISENTINRIIGRLERFGNSYLAKVCNRFTDSNTSGGNLTDYASLINRNAFLNLRIRGHFQSQIYTDSVCLRDTLIKKVMMYSSRKSPIADVVIHIRRGDYLLHRNYGPLSIDYFNDQLSKLPSKSRIILHSDSDLSDLASLQTQRFEVLDGSMSSNPWDLLNDALLAQKFIGSNSTLSWWAAYLAQSASPQVDGKVTMPDHWMRDWPTEVNKLMLRNWSYLPSIWES